MSLLITMPAPALVMLMTFVVLPRTRSSRDVVDVDDEKLWIVSEVLVLLLFRMTFVNPAIVVAPLVLSWSVVVGKNVVELLPMFRSWVVPSRLIAPRLRVPPAAPMSMPMVPLGAEVSGNRAMS